MGKHCSSYRQVSIIMNKRRIHSNCKRIQQNSKVITGIYIAKIMSRILAEKFNPNVRAKRQMHYQYFKDLMTLQSETNNLSLLIRIK